MEASIGVNLRVTAHSNQGGRRYMEDMFCVAYQPTTDERDLLYAYFGIFDGHGGRDAALYAKTHLMDEIVSQKNFWADDDESVLRAIRDGFINTHYAMWKELDIWPKTQSGLPSTSGTTASVAFVRRGKLYIGHVGDSAIVLGYQDPTTGYWRAKPLTKDHKPESADENARITKCGGKVISKSGVPRVVWNRPRIGHKGPVRRSTPIDEIPFLAVARSLGDLWSYNSTQNEFVVSPVPDVSVIDIDVTRHRCLILGSDGLWNMLSSQDAVNGVYFAEKNNERQLLAAPPHVSSSQVKNWINPSKRLVDRALDKWYQYNLRADNTSVVTVVIDPPGPPKAQVLRQNQRSQMLPQSAVSAVDSTTVRPNSAISTVRPTIPPTYRTARPMPANAHVPHNYHGNQHRSLPRQNLSAAPAGSMGDKKLPRPVTVDAEPHPCKPRHASHAALRVPRDVEQLTSAKTRVMLKRKSEVVIKHPHKLTAMMRNASVAVTRYAGPSTSSASSTIAASAAQNVSANVKPKGDVQIHEISSSSESSKSEDSFTGRKTTQHRSGNVTKAADTVSSKATGKRLTRYTTQPRSDVAKLSLGQTKSRKLKAVVAKRTVVYSKRFLRKKHITHSTPTTLAKTSRKSSKKPDSKASVPVPEMSSNHRSLRSSARAVTRVTRSMRK